MISFCFIMTLMPDKSSDPGQILRSWDFISNNFAHILGLRFSLIQSLRHLIHMNLGLENFTCMLHMSQPVVYAGFFSRGGGGGTLTICFLFSKFLGQFSRHRVGVALIHHQPLWQASKRKKVGLVLRIQRGGGLPPKKKFLDPKEGGLVDPPPPRRRLVITPA